MGQQTGEQPSKGQHRNKYRSRSRHRQRLAAEMEKKTNKNKSTASSSLVSVPNTIKLSMLSSGLLPPEQDGLFADLVNKPVDKKNFLKQCIQRRKFPIVYKLEFQNSSKYETHSCRHGGKAVNKEKNQNQKVIPYDYNRVVLDTLPDVRDSDYINASYVDSHLKPNAYIVTQGPNERTVDDFWRMVWQTKAKCIVMLTKTFDFIKVMCVKYWPAAKDREEVYGGIAVTVLNDEQSANYNVRTLRLRNNSTSSALERLILQFHYVEWPCHSCPHSSSVLDFRRRVRTKLADKVQDDGPVVVHCNDGGGRSGVFLSIDANLELLEEDGAIDVYGYFKKMRQSRKGLIERPDEYRFVYDTLEEHVILGESWFPVSELSERLKQKSVKDPRTKMTNAYQTEYQQICKHNCKYTIGDCAGGHRPGNREKNRDVMTVPPDNFRPYLTSFQGNMCTDYVNAVFVDGYTRPREYIVTEYPMTHTISDFWSLIYDYEASAVVVLCNPEISVNYPALWPESRSKKYGNVFTVDHVSHSKFTNVKSYIFRIHKKIISLTELMAGVKAPSKSVQLFQLTCWPMDLKVPTSTNSLVELMNTVERWRQRIGFGPVVVVSPDGVSRAGVYCAANACIEQAIQHREVDVFQAVLTVRRNRPQLIDSMTEYKYCYDVVLHYVSHYLHKETAAEADINEK